MRTGLEKLRLIGSVLTLREKKNDHTNSRIGESPTEIFSVWTAVNMLFLAEMKRAGGIRYSAPTEFRRSFIFNYAWKLKFDQTIPAPRLAATLDVILTVSPPQ